MARHGTTPYYTLKRLAATVCVCVFLKMQLQKTYIEYDPFVANWVNQRTRSDAASAWHMVHVTQRIRSTSAVP